VFDTGNGVTPAGATAGRMIANMAAAGIDPARVTDVIQSHFHGAHLNGLLNAAGGRAFPNAQGLVDDRVATTRRRVLDTSRPTAPAKRVPPPLRGEWLRREARQRLPLRARRLVGGRVTLPLDTRARGTMYPGPEPGWESTS
jgi:glyoxylase-like metal-dependent hydrolase (beta-lactamase superfamily II)